METQQEEWVRVADADREISDPAFFRYLLKAVSRVVEEPILTLDPEGLRIKQMSPDHKTMVDLYIPGEHFRTYNVYEERTISFNVKELLKLVFKRGKMKDTLILMRIEAERITFDIRKDGGRVRKVLPLFGPVEEEESEPTLYFKSEVKIMTRTLINVIEDCKTLEDNENILITVKDEEISFSGIDGDYSVENIFEQYADEIISFRTEGTQKATYTTERILTLVKALKPFSEALTLELSTDIPARITADDPITGGHLIYYLGPCVGYTEPDPDPQEDLEVEPDALEVETVEVDPHEDFKEIPDEEPFIPGFSLMCAVKDLGFFAYSGADGDLFRKHGLAGWRISFNSLNTRIQEKQRIFTGDEDWVTIREFNGEDEVVADAVLGAVKELIEKGTLHETLEAIPIPHEEARDKILKGRRRRGPHYLPRCWGYFEPDNTTCVVDCSPEINGSCMIEKHGCDHRAEVKAAEAIPIPYEEPAEIVEPEPVIEIPEEIPTLEAAPDPQEDMSLGELYLQYYAEARARFSAEAS